MSTYQIPLSRGPVLETLLKTNRPPTDQERAIICESLAPTNEKLGVVEEQISDMTAHIQTLRARVQRAETKLQCLREQKEAILETSKDHRGVISAVRNLPEDILREILIACVQDERPPILSYGPIPLPYRLAQISRGFRRIALSTSIMWASMDVQFGPFDEENLNAQEYSILAHMATEWFERAGGLPLTVFIDCPSAESREPEPSDILLDALFSYSARWREIQFNSSGDQFSMRVLRIVALKAVDLPVLRSVSLCLDCSIPTAVLANTVLFKTPTLRCVSLITNNLRQISVNWADLTAISLQGRPYSVVDLSYSKNEIAGIFQRTKRLVSCHIVVGLPSLGEEIVLEKISLPFLQTLHITETVSTQLTTSNESPSLLDLLSAPILAELNIQGEFFDLSLLNFLKQTPRISKLDLPYLKDEKSLEITLAFLRHCPSLTALSLRACYYSRYRGPSNWDGNAFLRSFVVVDGNGGVTCPCLEFFKFDGPINFSLETLRLFLEGKQRLLITQNISPRKITPWRMVTIGMQGIEDTATHNNILSLVFQKQSEGMNVDLSFS